MSRLKSFPGVFLVSVVLLVLAGCGAPYKEPTTLKGKTMGTTYTVKIVDSVESQALLAEDIDAKLKDVNQLMSTYIPDSELSQLNQAPIGVPQQISDQNREILAISQEIYELSEGRFDVTIGPLIKLWGFGTEFREEVPEEASIAEAMAKTGPDTYRLEGNEFTRLKEGYVDLSAIAKGWGVDQVAELLVSRGYENFMVEIGGEIRTSGNNGRGNAWRIAIEKPDALSRSLFATVPISGYGMATSGDYRNYFEVDGVRYSHTLDPVTGRPITHKVASVTVIHPSAAWADGLATAIDVLGAEKGLALANAHDWPVFVILKTENGFEAQHSKAFEPFMEADQD